MLRDEVRKNNEDEAAKAQERLVSPPSNGQGNNENGKDEDELIEKAVDEKVKKKALPEEGSESSAKIEEELKEEQPADHQDDLHGSTVEIVQPADLKPKHLGFTRTLLLAMFAAMIGTGAQFGYALGVMNAPSQVSPLGNHPA